ncbi:MAG: glycosyltransferase [Mobilitalea sp.]
MNLGILITSIGNFGKRGFYNAQEIGLAKEFDKLFDEVTIYKAIPLTEPEETLSVEGCKHTTLHRVPVKSQGTNGLWNCDKLDKRLDVLIYFSDTQLSVPQVYKWCSKNNVKLFPYIGVIESHSTDKIKKIFIDWMFKKSIRIYKKCTCFAKSPDIKAQMLQKGITNCVLATVGLDFSLMHSGYERESIELLSGKWGYQANEKILLFIGRLTDEKQPIKMIDYFYKLYKYNSSYRLLMIGTGELIGEVEKAIDAYGINDKVKIFAQILNTEIWQLYRIADCFVNLNQHEIFGMAILEAMYYGCKVVAWKAPGPSYIIEDSVSGYLCNNEDELINHILHGKQLSKAAHLRIVDQFNWQASANVIYEFAGKGTV